MSWRLFLVRTALVVAAVVPTVLGAVTLTHTFTEGTVASAAEVNRNFTDLKAAVDALESPGAVLGVGYAELATSGTGNVELPRDTTIPQNTEGTEILTLTYTPRRANSRLLVEAVTYVTETANFSNFVGAALFRDSQANAIGAGYNNGQSQDLVNLSHAAIPVSTSVISGSTAATTFKLRVGGDGGTPQYRWNSDAQTRLSGAIFGGAMKTTLKVTEIAQ